MDVGVRGKHAYEQQTEPLYVPSDVLPVPLSMNQACDNVFIAK